MMWRNAMVRTGIALTLGLCYSVYADDAARQECIRDCESQKSSELRYCEKMTGDELSKCRSRAANDYYQCSSRCDQKWGRR